MSEVQAAAFVLEAGEPAVRLETERGGERLRCASVMKPLLAWVAAALAPYDAAPQQWSALARAAVTVSGNDETVRMWEACGAGALLEALERRTGVRFGLEPGGARSFGRVLTTAGELARAYAALAAAGDDAAVKVRRWMLAVPDRQTFGVRPVVARELHVAAADVAVKCGWFCDSDEDRVRTHVVTLTATDAGVAGTAVVTALAVDEAFRHAYAELYERGDEVLGLHERRAGATVRAATERAVRLIAPASARRRRA